MLFVRGKAEKVTPGMVDGSPLANAVAGNEYKIKFSYTYEGEKIEKRAKIIAIFELLCLASLREKAEPINGEP